jgi:hypothetical protein
MGWIITAAVGGFCFGALIFGLAGFALGYVQANKHNLAAGTQFLQNVAAAQAKQQPQPSSKRTSNLN